MNKADLEKLCGQRGLDTAGKVDQLKARLAAANTNHNAFAAFYANAPSSTDGVPPGKPICGRSALFAYVRTPVCLCAGHSFDPPLPADRRPLFRL